MYSIYTTRDQASTPSETFYVGLHVHGLIQQWLAAVLRGYQPHGYERNCKQNVRRTDVHTESAKRQPTRRARAT